MNATAIFSGMEIVASIRRRVRARCCTGLLFAVSLALCAAEVVAADAPHMRDVVLIIDNSASMKANDSTSLTKQALLAFTKDIPQNTRIAMITFDHEIRLAMPLTVWGEGGAKEFPKALTKINYKGKRTKTADALERALYEISKNGRKGADFSVVLLTDGQIDSGDKLRDREGVKWIRGALTDEAASTSVKVYGIAFTDKADVITLQSLARRTSATYLRAFQAADLGPVFQQIHDLVFAPKPVPTETTQARNATKLPIPREKDPAPAAIAPKPKIGTTASTAGTQVTAQGGNLPMVPAAEPPKQATAPAPAQINAAANPIKTAAASLPSVDTPTQVKSPQRPTAASTATLATSTTAPAPATSAMAVAAPASSERSFETWVLLALVAGMLCLAIAVLAVVFQSRSRNAAPLARPRATPSNASVSISALDAVKNADAHLIDVARVSGSAEIKLLAPMVVVGRVATNTQADDAQSLVIEQSTIGRRHATIEFRHGGFWLRDAQSLNGTFVNDERLAADASLLLKVNDRIRFHDVEFRFASAQQAADQTVFAEVGHAANEKTVYAQDVNAPSNKPSPPADPAQVAAPEQAKIAKKVVPTNAQAVTESPAQSAKPAPATDRQAKPVAAQKHEKRPDTSSQTPGVDTLDADSLEPETLLSVSLTSNVALAKNRDVKPTGPNLQLLDLSEVSGAAQFELTGQNVSIGKAAIPERGEAANYLSIPRNTVSKLHAKLHFADSTYWISDNHSANGTFVNDLRVIDRIALHVGDTLRFATFEFTVTAVAVDTASVDGNLPTSNIDFATDSTSIIEQTDDADSDKTMMMNE